MYKNCTLKFKLPKYQWFECASFREHNLHHSYAFSVRFCVKEIKTWVGLGVTSFGIPRAINNYQSNFS